MLPFSRARKSQKTKDISYVPYQKRLEQIEIKREEFSSQFNLSNDKSEQSRILQSSRDFLYDKLLNGIFPAWYGTEWHFQGITDKPKTGEFPITAQSKVDTNRIACGYFITRILSDLGFKIKVYKLAQQPATLMIKNLTPKESWIFSSNHESVQNIKMKIREINT